MDDFRVKRFEMKYVAIALFLLSFYIMLGQAQEETVKARLQFLVGHLARYLKKGRYAQVIGSGAPVYLAVVLEYLVAEVLELARNAARDNKKNRIIPCHIQLEIRNDEELGKLLSGVTIAHGGVLPNKCCYPRSL
ncbi:hypothetical protein L7F22_058312 [Adiantum nelumboides]|nr:hypothetical protein [Adiantum nelumboides]